MLSFRFLSFGIVSLLGGLTLALDSTPDSASMTKSPLINAARSANTCADHSLLEPIYQSYSPARSAHGYAYFYAFENVNSGLQAIFWGNIQPAFQLWPTQQDFTVPLWQLASAGAEEYIYRIGADANTPPVVSGFTTEVLVVGWVYDTQVCGSVPLMSLSLPPVSDAYLTTSAFQHDGFIKSGWTDNGVVAFVMPLDAAQDTCCTV